MWGWWRVIRGRSSGVVSEAISQLQLGGRKGNEKRESVIVKYVAVISPTKMVEENIDFIGPRWSSSERNGSKCSWNEAGNCKDWQSYRDEILSSILGSIYFEVIANSISLSRKLSYSRFTFHYLWISFTLKLQMRLIFVVLIVRNRLGKKADESKRYLRNL